MWAQLSSWYKQTVYDPTASLSAERRGTLSLPDVESCYNSKEKYDARVSRGAALSVLLLRPGGGSAWWFINMVVQDRGAST